MYVGSAAYLKISRIAEGFKLKTRSENLYSIAAFTFLFQNIKEYKRNPLRPYSKGQEAEFLRYHPNWRIAPARGLNAANVGRFSRPPSWSHSPCCARSVPTAGSSLCRLVTGTLSNHQFIYTAILCPFPPFVKSKARPGRPAPPGRKVCAVFTAISRRSETPATRTADKPQNIQKNSLRNSRFPARPAPYNERTVYIFM